MSLHPQMIHGPFVGTGLHIKLSILDLALGREWGLHKYSGVSHTMGFICTTEEDYFCKITAYIKAHMCLYCFWHPEALFTRFCQPRFLSEQRPHTTIGWTILQNLSRGLSWGSAYMRSQYENMAWLDFYFSKWSHSLKALIILTGEKYSLPESQQDKNKEKKHVRVILRTFPCDFTRNIFHLYIIRMDIQSDITGKRYMRKVNLMQTNRIPGCKTDLPGLDLLHLTWRKPLSPFGCVFIIRHITSEWT